MKYTSNTITNDYNLKLNTNIPEIDITSPNIQNEKSQSIKTKSSVHKYWKKPRYSQRRGGITSNTAINSIKTKNNNNNITQNLDTTMNLDTFLPSPLRYHDSFQAETSSDTFDEVETKYRVAAYCTCSTYLLTNIYNMLTTMIRLSKITIEKERTWDQKDNKFDTMCKQTLNNTDTIELLTSTYDCNKKTNKIEEDDVLSTRDNEPTTFTQELQYINDANENDSDSDNTQDTMQLHKKQILQRKSSSSIFNTTIVTENIYNNTNSINSNYYNEKRTGIYEHNDGNKILPTNNYTRQIYSAATNDVYHYGYNSRDHTTSLQYKMMSTMHTIITYYGSDVLNIRFRDNITLEQKQCFIFDYGCIAFFNFTIEEEMDILKLLQQYEEETLPENEREAGVEDILYINGTRSQVTNDTITLASTSTLEKLSIAFAMAQCVKLNIFEERVDREIEKTRDLPESLAKTGSIGLTRTEMAKKIGKLFIERNNINLHADILDDPEFFWKQDKYKYVYEKLYKYLELNKRVALLNKRLVIMKELFDMISSQLETTHTEKLELIVIYLIVVEVVVSVGWQIIVKDIFGFFQRCGG